LKTSSVKASAVQNRAAGIRTTRAEIAEAVTAARARNAIATRIVAASFDRKRDAILV